MGFLSRPGRRARILLAASGLVAMLATAIVVLAVGNVTNFEIDGDLSAGEQNGGGGPSTTDGVDWARITGTQGTEALVFDAGDPVASGANPSDNPAEPGTAFFFRDPLKVDPDPTTFTQGDKENDCKRPKANQPCTTTSQGGVLTSDTPWHIVEGGVPPNKDDLFDVLTYARISGSQADVDLGLVRTNNNGNSHVDFEMNRFPWEPCEFDPAQDCPVRAEGDLLVAYEITQDLQSGTSTTTAQAFVWDLPGGVDATPSGHHFSGQGATTGCDGDATGDTTVCPFEEIEVNGAIVSTLNRNEVPAGPWGSRLPDGTSTTTIPPFGFFETFLDVDALGLGPGCPGFAQASVKSRSSGSSVSSAMTDLAGPFPIDLNTCAKLTIVKDTVPNGPQDFSYSSTGGLNPASFILDDDSDGTRSDRQVYEQIPPGTYTVTETKVNGFDLTTLTCSDATSSGSSGTAESVNNVLTGKVTITLNSLGDLTCTYVNTQRSSLIIKKTAKDASTAVSGAEPLGGVTFTITPDPTTGTGSLDVTDRQLGEAGADVFNNTEGLICVDNVLSGTYAISEKTVPTGYKKGANQSNVAPTLGTCTARGTSATPNASFENVPLSNIRVIFSSQATGENGPATVSKIDCNDGTQDPADGTPTAFNDTDETYKDIEPGLVTCTIDVDP